MKQALDVNAKSAIAHRVQGLVFLGGGDDAAAFQAFSKAAQEDPRDTTSRLNMGAVLLRAGAYAKAAEQYKSALAAAPDEPAAQIGLAAALRGESDGKNAKLLDEAKSLLEKVIEHDSHNVAANFNLGVLYADSLKKPAEAKPYFERFLDDAPKDRPSRPEAERQVASAKSAPPTHPSSGHTRTAPACATPATASRTGKEVTRSQAPPPLALAHRMALIVRATPQSPASPSSRVAEAQVRKPAPPPPPPKKPAIKPTGHRARPLTPDTEDAGPRCRTGRDERTAPAQRRCGPGRRGGRVEDPRRWHACLPLRRGGGRGPPEEPTDS